MRVRHYFDKIVKLNAWPFAVELSSELRTQICEKYSFLYLEVSTETMFIINVFHIVKCYTSIP